MGEFLAQKRHIDFKVVGLEFAVESPRFENEIFFGRNKVGVFKKISQQFKFLAREVDASFLCGKRERGKVERRVAVFEFVVREKFASSSEHRTDARGKFVEREWL